MNTTTELSDEVQELVWALIDEQATDDQIEHLEELLLENKDARQVYVMCMQMHADLHYLLGGYRNKLPAAVLQAVEAKKSAEQQKAAKKKTPLPVFEFPAIPLNVPMPESMVS